MKIERVHMALLALAVLITVPIASAIRAHANIKRTSHRLELRVESVQAQIKKRDDKIKKAEAELKAKQLENQTLQNQKNDLEKQLQSKRQQQSVIAQAVNVIVPAAQADPGGAKGFIYMKESGNNPGSINPSSGACGLGQALPCSKMPCSLSDYGCQDAFFTDYMAGRYGTWENAKAFWLAHSWW